MVNSLVEEIKSRLDLVEVVSQYLKLQKAGANYRTICPFHSEKTPSLFVSPAKQIWHCFGCSAGGDVVRFVMMIEGIEFGDALRILAQRAGVELKRESPELRSERQRLYEVCELACCFFEKQLSSNKKGEEAKNYLLKRRVNQESIKEWRLGYAPDSWKGLSDFLVSRGYKREEIVKAGLAIEKEGKFYDRFRDRIIFPIFDLNSQVIGFGGRIVEGKEDEAKYINTPTTLLYDKSRVLYGLDKAKVAARKEDAIILVEGYVDAIMVRQAGFENVVAVSGTALTEYHLRILKRYTNNLLIAFDMDLAGNSATKRGIDMAQKEDFNIKVIVMNQKDDPAEVVSRSPQEWKELVNNARSILQFYFETAFANFDNSTPEGKRKIADFLLPPIKRIPNKIEQAFWVQRLAQDLGVKEEDVREQLANTSLTKEDVSFGEESQTNLSSQTKPKSRKELLEERAIALLVGFPEYLSSLEKEELTIFSPKIQTLLKYLQDQSNSLSEELQDYFNRLTFQSEIQKEEDDSEPEKELRICLREIKTIILKENLQKISQELKKAEFEKNFEKVKVLLEKFNEISLRLKNA